MTKASTDGWASATTLGLLAVAAVLLVAFVVIERFSSHPLLPLRVVTERNRGGSYLTTLLIGLGLLGTFLFLTYYLQQTLHYSALQDRPGLPALLGGRSSPARRCRAG